MQPALVVVSYFLCCFYLANSRQMQQKPIIGKTEKSCFYLANSRQMQLCTFAIIKRCQLFLPCKQQADATDVDDIDSRLVLFLPCKQQADATLVGVKRIFRCCFYLANSRQMQPHHIVNTFLLVVFTLQTAGRCNIRRSRVLGERVVFTLQTAGRCNAPNLTV